MPFINSVSLWVLYTISFSSSVQPINILISESRFIQSTVTIMASVFVSPLPTRYCFPKFFIDTVHIKIHPFHLSQKYYRSSFLITIKSFSSADDRFPFYHTALKKSRLRQGSRWGWERGRARRGRAEVRRGGIIILSRGNNRGRRSS